jgi:hypothetical protein
MKEWIQAPLIADLALGILAIEGVLVLALARRLDSNSRQGYLANLAAGAGLLLAYRTLAMGAHWSYTALALTLSLVAHASDVAMRLGARESSRRCDAGTAAAERPGNAQP